jgi:uncharacterized membrane protein YvbJ
LKPCKQCGAPLRNDAQECGKCGRRQPPGVRLAVEERGSEKRKPLDPKERGRWLRRELACAGRLVLARSAGAVIFALAGGALGYLAAGPTGMLVGAVLGAVLKLLLA